MIDDAVYLLIPLSSWLSSSLSSRSLSRFDIRTDISGAAWGWREKVEKKKRWDETDATIPLFEVLQAWMICEQGLFRKNTQSTGLQLYEPIPQPLWWHSNTLHHLVQVWY